MCKRPTSQKKEKTFKAQTTSNERDTREEQHKTRRKGTKQHNFPLFFLCLRFPSCHFYAGKYFLRPQQNCDNLRRRKREQEQKRKKRRKKLMISLCIKFHLMMMMENLFESMMMANVREKWIFSQHSYTFHPSSSRPTIVISTLSTFRVFEQHTSEIRRKNSLLPPIQPEQMASTKGSMDM